MLRQAAVGIADMAQQSRVEPRIRLAPKPGWVLGACRCVRREYRPVTSGCRCRVFAHSARVPSACSNSQKNLGLRRPT